MASPSARVDALWRWAPIRRAAWPRCGARRGRARAPCRRNRRRPHFGVRTLLAGAAPGDGIDCRFKSRQVGLATKSRLKCATGCVGGADPLVRWPTPPSARSVLGGFMRLRLRWWGGPPGPRPTPSTRSVMQSSYAWRIAGPGEPARTTASAPPSCTTKVRPLEAVRGRCACMSWSSHPRGTPALA